MRVTNYGKKALCLTSLLIGLFIPQANAQRDYKNVKHYIKQLITNNSLRGASVAYIQPDGNVHYFSFANPTKDDFKFTKNTIYEIGSVSKTFTTLILARMVQKGVVSLHTPIGAILPDTLNLPAYKGQKITLLNLATHTSGLPRLPLNLNPPDPLNPYASYNVKELYAFLDNYKLTRAPGTKLVYSNLGMGLLGHLLELKMNMSYDQLLQHFITGSLGMQDTKIQISKDNQDRFAMPYNFGQKVKHWNMPVLAGAGAIRSTSENLAIYLKAHMRLSQTPFDSAVTMTHKIRFGRSDNTKQTIGLSWLYATKYDTLIFHNGATGGFRSFVGWNSQHGSGVIVLASGTRRVDDIGMHMLDKHYQLTEIKQAIEIKSESLPKYTGIYAITPDFSIKIFVRDNHLMAQATGQKAFRIFPKSETQFFYKVVKAEIEFMQNDSGTITKLKLYQAGRVLRGVQTKNN